MNDKNPEPFSEKVRRLINASYLEVDSFCQEFQSFCGKLISYKIKVFPRQNETAIQKSKTRLILVYTNLT